MKKTKCVTLPENTWWAMEKYCEGNPEWNKSKLATQAIECFIRRMQEEGDAK